MAALGKNAVGLAAVVAAWLLPSHLPSRFGLFACLTLFYSGTAAVLILNGKRDRRALLLGVLFALIATTFADRLIVALRPLGPVPFRGIQTLFSIQVDAFIPWILWLFASVFPKADNSPRLQRWLVAVVRLSLSVGVCFLLLNVAAPVVHVYALGGQADRMLRLFSRYNDGGFYWPVQFALALPALPVILVRSRRATLDERRRTETLAWALVLGGAPSLIWLLLATASSTFATAFPIGRVGWLIYAGLLSIPLTTTYAVTIRRALDVSLVVRRAIRYAFARYTVMNAAAIPLIILGVDLYRRRNLSVADVASTPQGAVLLIWAVLAGLAMIWRKRLLDLVDRWFFREQFDARQILGRLTEHCRWIDNRRELAEVLCREIDRALHLESVDVLLLDEESRMLVGMHEGSAVADGSPLLLLVGATADPFEAEIDRWHSPLAPISAADREWLLSTGFRLFSALRAPDGQMVGLLALGAKRSELPFSAEDKRLLSGVCGAAEMTIGFHGLYANEVPSRESLRAELKADDAPPAAECPRCDRVFPPDRSSCEHCGESTVSAALPLVVADKFKIDSRLGRGAMGVVYRAVDLELQRVVAIKTLPALAPDRAAKLRREARAMALFSHPNLALIFGAEAWRERPILVVEFLAGGTLEDRLLDGSLRIGRVLEMGVALAGALAAAHRAGLLHRDIKPSNIGFSSDGVPKLLDFGLARALAVSADPIALHDDEGPAAMPRLTVAGTQKNWRTRSTDGSTIVGTPLYMSPEALVGECPDPSFDLWSLCVVLYECILGRHPLAGLTLGELRYRVITEGIPELEADEIPPSISAFLSSALALDPSRRPKDANTLATQLKELAGAIDAGTLVRSPEATRHPQPSIAP